MGEMSVYRISFIKGVANTVLLLWEQQCTANQSCLKHGHKKQLMLLCNDLCLKSLESGVIKWTKLDPIMIKLIKVSNVPVLTASLDLFSLSLKRVLCQVMGHTLAL